MSRVRFWTLLLCHLNGNTVAPSRLQRSLDLAELPADFVNLNTIHSAVLHLRSAHQELKHCQQNHQELWQLYLEDLAEAITIQQSPNLAHNFMSAVRSARTAAQVKILIQKEQRRRLYQELYRVLNDTKPLGLSKLDIPVQHIIHTLEIQITQNHGQVLEKQYKNQVKLPKK